MAKWEPISTVPAEENINLLELLEYVNKEEQLA